MPTSPSSTHPEAVRLTPGLRPLRRSPSTVQLGLDPRRGLLLEGLTAADHDLLDRLAGETGAVPVTPRETELVGLLDRAGLVLGRHPDAARLLALGPRRGRFEADARAWSHLEHGTDGWDRLLARRTRVVRVVDLVCGVGPSRVACAIAECLLAAGVGRVADTSRQRAVRGDPADLVVLVEPEAADAVRASRLVARDQPHLSVVVGAASVDVGPLVVPGVGACLRCLDLHRTDRDPLWPQVLAQLLARTAPQTRPAEEASLSRLAGSLAALQALALLDGAAAAGPCPPPGHPPDDDPPTVSATLQVRLPHGLVSRQEWPPHPECGCRWTPRSA